MPRRYQRKRRYKKKTNNLPKTVRLPGSQIVPDRMQKKFVVGGTQRMDGGVGTGYFLALKGNSLYNINYTYSGTSDVGGITIFEGLYKTYLVYAAKIEIEVWNIATTPGNGNIDCFLYPNNTPIPAVQDYGDVSNGLYVKKRGLTPVGSSKTFTKLTHYMSTKKMKADKDIDEAEYRGDLDLGSDPSALWYWNFQVLPVVTGNLPDINIRYKITYYAELSESKSQQQN